jgi:heme exporter protein C
MLNAISSLAMFGALSLIWFYAPMEAEQGIVQKIFYIHVACALTMYVGFFIAWIAAIMYLLERKLLWDRLAISSAEVGFFFCTVVLLTGPIWAKPIWGTWWTWDPRLTTTFLLWLMYAGYLVLRGFFAQDARGRVVTSVVLIIDFLVVPLVHFSVQLWRGIHPTVVGPKGGGIPTEMKLTLIATFAAIVIFFFSLLKSRFLLEKTRNELDQLRLQKSEVL